ncbi:MAG: glycosyltransferase [Bdellovibrionota bacterium]|nr:MAG: glycosyltransferase [Bdellovibrionota bacterium]
MESSAGVLIIPVYRSASGIPQLLERLKEIVAAAPVKLSCMFVIDGSPDQAKEILVRDLPSAGLRGKIVTLSRNFGAFEAIRAGLQLAEGDYFAIMAADCQEPASLMIDFFRVLHKDEADLVLGQREKREDPLMSVLPASIFWRLFRRIAISSAPASGIDVFGCNRRVRDTLVSMHELNSSLIGMLLWVGYRRKMIGYERQSRASGRSSWTFSKKFKYFADSLYGFSDLPIRLLTLLGVVGLLFSIVLTLVTVFAKVTGIIPIPGYAATISVVSLFGGLNCFGLGILGGYLWRTFENTKGRPLYIVNDVIEF